MKRPIKPKKKYIPHPIPRNFYSFCLHPTRSGIVLVPSNKTSYSEYYLQLDEIGEPECRALINLLKDYTSWHFSTDLHESERVSISAYLENPNYEEEMKQYEWAQENPNKAYEKAMKQYEKDLAVWKKQQRKEKIVKLKQQLEELQKKDVEDSETV